MRGMRDTSINACERCGCSTSRHKPSKGGCRNVGCSCPRSVVMCPTCGGWKSGYSKWSSGGCARCYGQQAEVRRLVWRLEAPERESKKELRRQRRLLRTGGETLRELKRLLRHGATSSQRAA